MFGILKNVAGTVLGKLAGAVGLASVGLKPLRYFIDSKFRNHVEPVEGSVLYCDLWVGAEHSGIYVGDGQISNIVVTDIADSQVQLSSARAFTSKSTVGKKIYVSCDKHGAVGDVDVSDGAMSHVGEQSFYGLVFKNCHEFSKKCVNYSTYSPSFFEKIKNRIFSQFEPEWESTLRELKHTARNKLGATKWRLWDWDNSAENEPEPDWDAQQEFFKNQALTPEFIHALRMELGDTLDYEDELKDEQIPDDIRQKLRVFGQTLEQISDKYEQMKGFLQTFPNAQFSYNDLQQCQGTDFDHLTEQIKNNKAIQELVKKMGRNYISEERKKQTKVPKASRTEVHGTQHSDDMMRLLPSELVNLEDETLELLFYSRLIEKNLLTYELSGTTWENKEESEQYQQHTGAIVACLDTSGSMNGEPLRKAKALLFAIANILKQEKRSLYVLIFGASGQIQEYALHGAEDLAGLLQFLQQGFNGGTDFETPLQRALDIIRAEKDYLKADILMISDGDCQLSNSFAQTLKHEKQALDCSVYSVLCAGQRVADNFSDEMVVL